jgi:hypothetical protein
MKEKFAKLLSVKSIVTIILTIIFAYLSVIGKVSGEQFLVIFTTVIAFYFGTQTEKKSKEETENGNK